MTLRVVDLFAGCGGMSLGFQNAGFEIVAGFDSWEPATSIYAANFDHPIYREDLSTEDPVKKIARLEPRVVIGGPPCQDFSISGKRNEGERANLTLRFGDIATQLLPEWIVFENVYNIKRFKTLSKMKNILTNAGYGISESTLEASYCGVPQNRRRYFLVASLGKEDGFFDSYFTRGLSEKRLTVREYMGDELDTDYYYMHPRSYARRAVFSIDEPASTIRGINRPIPSNYSSHRGDAADVSEGVRPLSTKERSRLQTFPPEFKLPGKKTQVELAIGNAVPPKMAEFVATKIIEYINEEEKSGR